MDWTFSSAVKLSGSVTLLTYILQELCVHSLYKLQDGEMEECHSEYGNLEMIEYKNTLYTEKLCEHL
jgi:hypothetical protein